MDEVQRIQAMEFIRQRGGGIDEQIEFAQFIVGFPDTMEMDQVYLSYIFTKQGPSQVSINTQNPEEYA